MKRAFDIVLAIICIILFSPLMLIFTLLIRMRLGKNVLFRQRRPGLHEKPFVLYKFRTMTDECDANGDYLPDALRLTKLGKFIRKYSIDELPQLINVLKGDMSFVGPRPLLMEYLPLYTEDQARRHLVKPGITGWAQVNGRNAISWEEKYELDVWYVDHQSFWLDIKILLLTVRKVMKSEGISSANHATMPVFEGSSNQ